jgi:2-dehydro-3-deoxyphosphogluconate aldolase/(4S)-4-hydroxy-2-oxoglutarate aldolase
MTGIAVQASDVAASLKSHPVVGVVRTDSFDEAERQAVALLEAGLQLVEITFTVPRATELVARLHERWPAGEPPWIGMGTVTGGERAAAAVAVGAEFIVSPNISAPVAETARAAGRYLIMGGLTPSEIVTARDLGADLIKVFPLPYVGGAAYLATVRGPLGDIPMLATGGFGVDEIPAYREAGAVVFSILAPNLGTGSGETGPLVRRALALARGEET